MTATVSLALATLFLIVSRFARRAALSGWDVVGLGSIRCRNRVKAENGDCPYFPGEPAPRQAAPAASVR